MAEIHVGGDSVGPKAVTFDDKITVVTQAIRRLRDNTNAPTDEGVALIKLLALVEEIGKEVTRLDAKDKGLIPAMNGS